MGLAKDLSMTAAQFYNCVTLLCTCEKATLRGLSNLIRLHSRGIYYYGASSKYLESKTQTQSFNRWWCDILWGHAMWDVRSEELCYSGGAQIFHRLWIESRTDYHYLHQPLLYTRRTRDKKWQVEIACPLHENPLISSAAIYYASATTSGAFGGVIAYGIQRSLTYDATGRHPWQWLFLIEGVLAIGIGLLIMVFLPRYADDLLSRGKKHWLFTAEEIAVAAKRAACEYWFPCPIITCSTKTSTAYNTEGAKVQYSQLLATFKDPKTYLFAICQSASVLGVGVVGSFLPIFIHDFGFAACQENPIPNVSTRTNNE